MGPTAGGKGIEDGTFGPSDTYCTLEMTPTREAKPCSAHSVEESMSSESLLLPMRGGVVHASHVPKTSPALAGQPEDSRRVCGVRSIPGAGPHPGSDFVGHAGDLRRLWPAWLHRCLDHYARGAALAGQPCLSVGGFPASCAQPLASHLRGLLQKSIGQTPLLT